jgi:superfamily II DNA or RNA helicase
MILVVSDRLEHLELLKEISDRLEIKSEILTSKRTAKERKAIVEMVNNKEIHVLYATLSLICEGFDASGLSSLFMATPMRSAGRLIQVIGRILRPEEGKVPRIYDFRDSSIKTLLNQGFSRDRLYKKQWGAMK